jgi:3-deoxy-7-phosphoheptulonate synthase
MSATWTPSSWRARPAGQQPEWPDQGRLDDVLKRLGTLPPLVFAGEARRLTAALGEVAQGRAFLLQAGDCAESFDGFSADSIRDKLKVILQMAVVLTYGSGVPVVKLGRIAGQFAKPRSSATETVGDRVLPAFRGYIVNDTASTEEARVADPERLIQAYNQSASTLNLLRAFTKGGFADLNQVHVWNQEFVSTSREGQRYETIASEIERALRFMAACGIDLSAEEHLQDSLTGQWYDCSAHLVWIGDRTRHLDGAHVEFARGLHNPVAVKLGPSVSPDETVALCDRLDPDRTPGRLMLISRMGVDRIEELLPPIVQAVRTAGHPVVWECDPMHGNTFVSPSGRKTRDFATIMSEIRSFFAVHRAEGTWPGGVHIELTGDDVTECLGGGDDVADLDERYETACDPRLNARQSLDLAFQLAELLRS